MIENDNKNVEEIQIIQTIQKILQRETFRETRNGRVKSIFGVHMRFNLQNQFPLSTIRRMNLRGIFEELMLFIRGQTDVTILQNKKVHIWDDNTRQSFLDQYNIPLKENDMGATYPFQFRYQGAEYIDCKTDYTGKGFDQLNHVINTIKENPTDRRLIINLWNWNDMGKMALPPCGFLYMFYVEDGYLNCTLTQRSSDIVLAGGWNIASVSLLVYMIAHVCNLKPGELVWNINDCHVYENQLKDAELAVSRMPKKYPTLKIIKSPVDNDITNFEFDHFELIDYKPHSKIKGIKMNA